LLMEVFLCNSTVIPHLATVAPQKAPLIEPFRRLNSVVPLKSYIKSLKNMRIKATHVSQLFQKEDAN